MNYNIIMMLPQLELIERVRHICQSDERIVAAMMYGSFPRGEGDRYSDIEFVIFFQDDLLPSVDQRAWVSQIAPLLLYFDDDVGHHTAIFEDLLRGEFHFNPASQIPTVATWGENAWFPTLESTVLLDRTGELSRWIQPLIGPPPERDTPAVVESLAHNFINWLLFGLNVLDRGESARALALLSITHPYLLKMVRLVEGTTEHWPTPSKGLEQDISPEAYARFVSCTAQLDPAALRGAYRAAWDWGLEMLELLYRRHTLALPGPLIDRMTERIKKESHNTNADKGD